MLPFRTAYAQITTASVNLIHAIASESPATANFDVMIFQKFKITLCQSPLIVRFAFIHHHQSQRNQNQLYGYRADVWHPPETWLLTAAATRQIPHALRKMKIPAITD
jgi:hypothetical protein